jgi:hypothetical protein
MQIEYRVERARRPNVVIGDRQAADDLAPDQFRAPDVEDKRLHVRISANAARKLKQRWVGVEMSLPEVS